MLLKELLLYFGIFLALAIVAYLLTRMFVQNKMLLSKTNTAAVAEGDQYYYLPGYALNLGLNASIQITKDDHGKIINHQILRLDAEPEVVLQADTGTLITLKYIADPFSSDELKIVTSPASLLQNISTDATDRIATIVNLFTDATKQLAAQTKSIKESLELNPMQEIIETAKTFRLSPEELSKGEKTIQWKVPVQEQAVNISFTLKNKNFTGAVSLPDEYNGILTRPMSNQTWEITDGLTASFTCYAPDYCRIIKVPVRRAYFSRRQHLPGFSNGLLVENQITKHSEMEGLASVPLNILKAIFSIPAQLFQFTIKRK